MRIIAASIGAPKASRPDVSCNAKPKKKKPQYGSGREKIQGATITESLHFGRLIGESAKDTAEKLEQSFPGASNGDAPDARARLYLEKWQQSEDASYEMFESLLNGKPLDERAKKIKDLEFASIMEMSTDDEVLEQFEPVALSPTGESEASAIKKVVRQAPEPTPIEPPSYDSFAALLDPGVESNDRIVPVPAAASPEPASEPETSTPSKSPAEEAVSEDRKANKRQRNIARAKALLKKNGFVEATIWKANRAGLLIDADHITGFLPFKELTNELKQKVRSAQDQAAIHFQENGDRAREAGMNVLMGQRLSVRVISVDDVTERVVFSMEAARSSDASNTISQEMLLKASTMVGSVLPTTVTNVTDFGVFCRFDVDGTTLVGLVYRTEISWLEEGDSAMKCISVGDSRMAKVVHVDQKKAHVFLSFKRTTPNPLLETLDTLMMGGGGTSGPSSGTGRETVESIDLRPLLGDMEDAQVIAKSLRQAGFHSVSLGARLNSKATSQQVEVYLSKPKDGDEEVTTMIVRRGDAVQEIIIGSGDRARIKQVVSAVQLDL